MNQAIGHNSNKTRAGGVAADQLESIISRIETVDEEIAGLNADKRDILSSARGEGFDVKAIRTIIKMRKMDAGERREAETVLETYLVALGMQADLFDADS